MAHQPSGISNGLVAAKSRLNYTTPIPKLELMAGHKVKQSCAQRERGPGCSLLARGSGVALYWIKGSGEYKQFVSN